MNKFTPHRTSSWLARQSWKAAVALGVALFCGGLPGLHIPPVHATDAAVMDASGGQQQSGRFLRLGTAKSAVIKLPGAVKEVIVGESAIVDVVLRQQNTAYLFARKPGQTNIFFLDANGQEILHLDLEVAIDSKALSLLIDRSLPGHSVQVDGTGGNIVLKGTVANAQESKMAEDLTRGYLGSGNFFEGTPSIVNLLKIAEGQQVMLKVRVVELKRTVLKQLGVNLEGTLGGVEFTNSPVRILENLGSRILDAKFGLGGGNNSIDVVIKALEEQGLATTLAEPTLTAVSGAPASFLAGGEYPYRVCEQDEISLNCTVQFKPYGVTLGFTPTVLSGNKIALNIATEVSELGKMIDRIPSIDTRRAQTSVEIQSGGSMMMAGLIKDVTTQEIKGTPGLRTLPVLGALFSSSDYQQNQTELVVIVTPYIAKPVQEQQLATPVDRFNPATDLQQIFLGRLNRVYGAPGDRPAGVYHGKVGHIID
jgi:pilus assembly protein CpaC